MIQKHLDNQEHIWNSTTGQNRTSSSNVAHHFKQLPNHGTSGPARHPSQRHIAAPKINNVEQTPSYVGTNPQKA